MRRAFGPELHGTVLDHGFATGCHVTGYQT